MTESSRRKMRVGEPLGAAVVAIFGILWLLVCILVAASPVILMFALAYWLVKHA